MSISDFLAIESLLTERVRLAIISLLAASDQPLGFNDLIEKLDLTKGNLASHMRKLEDAGLASVHKEFVDRKSHTTYSCTEKGQNELNRYLEALEAMLKASQDKG